MYTKISYRELKETEETREHLSSAGLRAEDLTRDLRNVGHSVAKQSD
jgi:hypothetical protein